MMRARLLLGFCIVANAFGQSARQTPIQTQRPTVPPILTQDEFITNRPSNAPTSIAGKDYLIGKDDLIEVTVFEVPELNSTTRVSASGLISVPLVGSVEAIGISSRDLEGRIEESLRKNSLNDPHVTVFVREYASQPVSVVGAVRAPGIYQMKGQKALLDVLAQAQGLDLATAGDTIQIMRRGTEGSPSETISISVEDLTQNGKSDLNVPIQANNVINVLQEGSIFMFGMGFK